MSIEWLTEMRPTDVTAPRSFAMRVMHFIASLVFVASCAGGEARHGSQDWNAERRRMVQEQLRGRDIRSARVLDAMSNVPRHLFVPEPERHRAYTDSPSADRSGSDDLATLYRCLHDSGAGHRARSSRA